MTHHFGLFYGLSNDKNSLFLLPSRLIFDPTDMERYFYDNFIKALKERHPRKSDLANALTEILPLEKESIYRRLRKDVYFTSEETMQIAGAWNISLDNIISTHPTKTRPFHFSMIEYVHPREADYKILENYNQQLQIIADDPNGIMVEVLNALPRGVYNRSELMTRLFNMKWLYKYGETEDVMPLRSIELPERMRKIDLENVHLQHQIPEVHSIHDSRFIERLVDDVLYFRSIGMVTQEEAAQIKKELLTLIDYMESVAIAGYFPGTKKKHYFYLSHRSLDTEYTLFESKDLTLSSVKVLERNSLASTDKKVFDRLMNMVQSTKRSSVLMSGSNALQQVEFFKGQRSVVMGI
jgi:hypothetical protein